MDKEKEEEARAKRLIPPSVAGLLALVAWFATESLVPVLLVGAAYFVGTMSGAQLFPWVKTIDERRKLGREVLEDMSEAEIGEVLAVVKQGRKIEAIKITRAKTGAGLAESKDAVELLEAKGLRWADRGATKA